MVVVQVRRVGVGAIRVDVLGAGLGVRRSVGLASFATTSQRCTTSPGRPLPWQASSGAAAAIAVALRR